MHPQQDRLSQGITALKTGNRSEAEQILKAIVRHPPPGMWTLGFGRVPRFLLQTRLSIAWNACLNLIQTTKSLRPAFNRLELG